MKRLTWISLLLCICLTAVACGSDAPDGVPAPDVGSVATGRYMEHEVAFPELDSVLAFQRTEPDTYYVLGSRGHGDDIFFEVHRSTDGCSSWEPLTYPGLNDLLVCSGGFDRDGGLYLTHFQLGEEAEEDGEASFETFGAFADSDGVTALDLPELNTYNSGVTVSDAGILVIDKGFSMTGVDPGTGRTVEYAVESMTHSGTYAVYGDTLAVNESEYIQLYSIATGQPTGRVEYADRAQDFRRIAAGEDASGFFYLDSGGLYHVSMDSAITEQLIDGALASFSMPTVYVQNLFACADGSFLALCGVSGGYELKRYVFDATVTREPTQELSVYSLREDDYIRQVIGLYQAVNPDIMVRYTCGLSGDDAVTAQDAMRALSTELLAGRGPDILIMDGLPVESYARQGALLDLEDALAADLSAMLPHVAATFSGTDGVFAVPTRISIPLIGGVGVEDINSLADIAAYVAHAEQKRIGVSAETILEHFHPLMAATWLDAVGALREDVVRQDLEALGKIADIAESTPYNRDIGGVLHQSMWWSGGGLALITGTVQRIDDLSALHTGLNERGEGDYHIFPGGGSGIYVPRSILAVNALGANTQEALSFVRFALDNTAQVSNLYSAGLPVREESLTAVAYAREPGFGDGIISSGYNDDSGDAFELSPRWPREEETAAFLTHVREADIPAHMTETVRGIIEESAAPLLLGDGTVEDTLSMLRQKLDRHLQEGQA